jgi:SAM-dependent methyltransferase
VTTGFAPALEQFRMAYAAHRASEGRDHAGAELRQLPYLRASPLARQWAVRARTFDAFVARVVRPLETGGRALRVLDLGAGNGWLAYRLAGRGHECVAIDVREDAVDGLGAASELAGERPFERLAASFESLPLPAGEADLAVFNASLHYATDLAAVFGEAVRVLRPGGCLAILDSPFYAREADGAAMVAEKRRAGHDRFGDKAEALLGLPFIEFLTRERLEAASTPYGLAWRRHRVRYPLWYELRPLLARLRGRRAPSRFDLWTATVR